MWGASGRISGARDQANRTVSYGIRRWDADERYGCRGEDLDLRVHAGGSGPELSAIKDPWGRVLTSVTYDAAGRGLELFGARGDIYGAHPCGRRRQDEEDGQSPGNVTVLEYTQTGQIWRKVEAGW